MIAFTSDSSKPSVITKIEELPIQFYLTGSRAWKTNSTNSDWDFFVDKKIAEHPVFVKFLNDFGAKKLDKRTVSYIDTSCHAVYRIRDQDTTVDIQLVHDVRVKIVAQTLLLREYPRGITGRTRSAVWNDKIALATDIVKSIDNYK